jgi:hypothetical protein
MIKTDSREHQSDWPEGGTRRYITFLKGSATIPEFAWSGFRFWLASLTMIGGLWQVREIDFNPCPFG